jgi:hypothetical protein
MDGSSSSNHEQAAANNHQQQAATAAAVIKACSSAPTAEQIGCSPGAVPCFALTFSTGFCCKIK